MTAPEPSQLEPAKGMTPSEYVDLADRELAAGNHRRAASLLWKATEATFINLAEERGIDHSDPDLIAVAKALESDGSAPKFHYRSGLICGKLMRDHGAMDLMSETRLKDAYKSTRQFIIKCIGEPQ